MKFKIKKQVSVLTVIGIVLIALGCLTIAIKYCQDPVEFATSVKTAFRFDFLKIH